MHAVAILSPACTISLLPLYMPGTSAQRHATTQLCSILNRAIREDDPKAIIHAAVFANAINILLVDDGAPQRWLQTLFHKSFPFVMVWWVSRFFARLEVLWTRTLRPVFSVVQHITSVTVCVCVCVC